MACRTDIRYDIPPGPPLTAQGEAEASKLGEFLKNAGVSKIGRVAVKRSLRGTGVGQMALQALVDAAIARGDQKVMLHAQASATRFYLTQGFLKTGEPFKEAGIEHIAMVKQLQ